MPSFKYRSVNLKRGQIRAVGLRAPRGQMRIFNEDRINVPLEQMIDGENYHVDPFHIVHHYSGVGTLVGLCDGKALWATNTYYLNDTEEIIYAINVYIDCATLLDCEENKKKAVEYWLFHCLSQRAPSNVFVCCFSKANDTLSQWRAYASRGGVAIGFDRRRLKLLAEQSGAIFGDVIYDTVKQSEIVLPQLEKLVGLLPFKAGVLTEEEYHSMREEAFRVIDETIYADFVKSGVLMKHPSFYEEQEVRFAISADLEKVKYRQRGNTLVPYLEIPLKNYHSKKLFETITFGPSNEDFVNRLDSVEQFLQSRGLECNAFFESTIPYQDT
jgi:hypothetical protein